jgi:hypothetical protein
LLMNSALPLGASFNDTQRAYMSFSLIVDGAERTCRIIDFLIGGSLQY